MRKIIVFVKDSKKKEMDELLENLSGVLHVDHVRIDGMERYIIKSTCETVMRNLIKNFDDLGDDYYWFE